MVRLDNQKDKLIAYISGEIDHHSARAIREEIDTNLEKTMPNELLLDFKDVSFMDSSGIGLVMGRFKLMKKIGGVVIIANTKENIKKVMRLAGLSKIVKIDD